VGFRFRRSVKVFPGVRINLSRSGISTSIGMRGAHVTVGHGKVRETIGLPGTGISYTQTQGTQQEARSEAQPAEVIEPLPKGTAWRGWLWIALTIAILVAIFFATGCTGNGIVKAKDGTYTVWATGSTLPSSSSPLSQSAYALKRAKEFCGQRDEELEVVKLYGRGPSTGQPPRAMLQFRCVTHTNDPH
jgi:hypothetical protein